MRQMARQLMNPLHARQQSQYYTLYEEGYTSHGLPFLVDTATMQFLFSPFLSIPP